MAKVTERRLHKLEWAAHDAALHRRWAAKASKLGVLWADLRVEARRSAILYALGLWPRYEQQEAARAGCTVAELRREVAGIVTAEAPPATGPDSGCDAPGGRTQAV
jgi:hypothetical protein